MSKSSHARAQSRKAALTGGLHSTKPSRTWTYGARAALTFRSSSHLPVRPVPAFTGVVAFLHHGGRSIRARGEVTGSPFETFAEAERACNTKLEDLEAGRAYSSKQRGTAVGEPHVGTTLVPEEPTKSNSALDPGAEVIATTTSE